MYGLDIIQQTVLHDGANVRNTKCSGLTTKVLSTYWLLTTCPFALLPALRWLTILGFLQHDSLQVESLGGAKLNHWPLLQLATPSFEQTPIWAHG
jgi:hypothetical protein